MQKNQQIPPRREVDVKARVTVLSMRAPAEEALVEVVELKPGLYVDRTLLPAENRNLKVCVLNTTTEAQTIATGTRLGNASSVVAVINGSENSDLATASYNNFLADIIEEAVKKLPDTVDAKQKRQVEELLQEHRNLFSGGTYDMGRTNLVQHSIGTGSHRPIRQALRRHPYAHLDDIDRQVQGLLENDLIEPAASPWASNVVLVKKKDGTFRLRVDYRRLNDVTYKDSYPLQHIDTCLGSMNGAAWFSTLDLRSGYHNIPIEPTDRDKTAPSAFQRLMDLV